MRCAAIASKTCGRSRHAAKANNRFQISDVGFQIVRTRARSQRRRRSSLRQGVARAVLDRRQRLSNRAPRRRHPALCRGGGARGRDRRETRRPDHSERRRHVAGRAIDRGRPGARHLQASQPDSRDQSRREMGARRTRGGARRAERGAAAAPPAIRARRVVGEPRDGWRHDGQQLERRPLGPLWQDPRPRDRAARGAVGRRARAFSPARSIAGGGGETGRQHRGARVSRDPRARRDACERDRAPVSEGAAPRRRLQPRCVRRSVASRRPDAHHRRLRRHARLHRRRQAQPRAAAGAEERADDRVRSPARRARGDADHPQARTVRHRGDGRLHPVARQGPSTARSTAARDAQRRRLGAAVRGVLR